jgi:diguanylate cyclase (GGDEF)-like protein
MGLHKSESAFAVFVLLILFAGLLIYQAHDAVETAGGLRREPERLHAIAEARRLIIGTGALLGASLLFGIFFIYPMIRTQARSEGRLREMTQSLSARSETLEMAALTDPLTGLRNRRYFDDALREYLAEFGRIGRPVGLMVLDLDRFKEINDTYGHDAGDVVLREVGQCLRDMTRYHDVVARLGGEEFAVVTPNMDISQLQKFAERIRKAISELVIAADPHIIRVTTSVGIAIWDGRQSAEAFYGLADRRLYQAKRSGRDRVCT